MYVVHLNVYYTLNIEAPKIRSTFLQYKPTSCDQKERKLHRLQPDRSITLTNEIRLSEFPSQLTVPKEMVVSQKGTPQLIQ